MLQLSLLFRRKKSTSKESLRPYICRHKNSISTLKSCSIDSDHLAGQSIRADFRFQLLAIVFLYISMQLNHLHSWGLFSHFLHLEVFLNVYSKPCSEMINFFLHQCRIILLASDLRMIIFLITNQQLNAKLVINCKNFF